MAMLRDVEFYHGVAIMRLIRTLQEPLKVELLKWDRSFNSYLLNDHTGLYIKYSTNRLSPWRFGFAADQLNEVSRLESTARSTVVALVCWEDGVVALTKNDMKMLIGPTTSKGAWISVSRHRRHQYEVNGSFGVLNRRISHSDFSVAVRIAGTDRPHCKSESTTQQ